MLVFSVLLPLLYVSCSKGSRIFFESDVHHTLFGNLTSLPDLFLESDGNASDTKDNETFDEVLLEIPDLFGFSRANLTNETYDLQDYIKINEMYSNFSKQFKKPTRRLAWIDYDDTYLNDEGAEVRKQEQIKNCLIQYVMNCRYEVGKAIAQTKGIKTDKRYKLGYLFNRMRRLKTEQLKMIGSAYKQYQSEYKQMYSLMRLYERVVHFDVDMRDIADTIKKIYATPDPCDSYTDKKTNPNAIFRPPK